MPPLVNNTDSVLYFPTLANEDGTIVTVEPGESLTVDEPAAEVDEPKPTTKRRAKADDTKEA